MSKPWSRWRGKWECDDCEKRYSTWERLRQHLKRSSEHKWCEKCDKDYSSYKRLLSHLVNSSKHGWCTFCDEEYDTKEDLRAHHDKCHALCPKCTSVFETGVGLHEHARQSHANVFRVDCKRFFVGESQYQAHRNSRLHTAAQVPCSMAHWGCRLMFVSVAAMLAHLEAGHCVSKANRHEIDRYVAANDHNNIITNPQRLLTDGGVLFDPPVFYATERAFNPFTGLYHCYFCSSRHRHLIDLNRHLASPKHTSPDIKLYRCLHCKAEFSVLSGLCQIESEKCGVARFGATQAAMDHLVGGFRRLAV